MRFKREIAYLRYQGVFWHPPCLQLGFKREVARVLDPVIDEPLVASESKGDIESIVSAEAPPRVIDVTA